MNDMKEKNTEHKSRPSLLDKLNDGMDQLRPTSSEDAYKEQYLIQPSMYGGDSHYRLYHHQDCVTYDVHPGKPDRPWLIPSHTLAVKLSIKTQLMIEMTCHAELLNQGWAPAWHIIDQPKYGLIIETPFYNVRAINGCLINFFVFGIV